MNAFWVSISAFVVLSLILAVRIDRKNNLKNIYNDENRQ